MQHEDERATGLRTHQLQRIEGKLTELQLAAKIVSKDVGVGEAAFDGEGNGILKSTVDQPRLVRIRANEYLAAKIAKRTQKLTPRVRLSLATSVDGSAVNLEGHAFSHKVLHDLKRGL